MRNFKIIKQVTIRDDISLKIYLREIDKYPLISFEQEVELAKQIKMGDKVAFKKLVNSNLRFVVSIKIEV